MSTSIELTGPEAPWAPPDTKPLDEAAWQAWVEKGQAQERRSGAARMKTVKWFAIAGLLAVAGLWSHLAAYDTLIRSALTACAIAVMFQATQARWYIIAAVFGGLALLYNPVTPIFSFSGSWQSALVLTSAVPFAASLAWPNSGEEHK